MKKLIASLLAAALALSIAACGGTTPPPASSGEGSASTSGDGGKPKMAVLLHKTGNIDDRSFVQGAWTGMQKFAQDHGMEATYFRAVDDSTSSRVDAIKLAVDNGIEIVVLPGSPWEPAVFVAQDMYPDLKMVLLDGFPRNEDRTQNRIEKNVYSIFFSEQESGFLAGYASVKEGLTNLGFIGGMAVPAVVRYGYGFVQGAELAARDMGLKPGDVTIKYHYLGNFSVSPENQTFAASWYVGGTECIFFAAGSAGNSGMAAAQQVGPDKRFIGVDIDQSGEGEFVLTSATKDMSRAAYSALEGWYNNSFPGGESIIMDASMDAVGLPTEEGSFRFEHFTMADYEAIYDRLRKNTDNIASDIPTDQDYQDVKQIPVELVKVEMY